MDALAHNLGAYSTYHHRSATASRSRACGWSGWAAARVADGSDLEAWPTCWRPPAWRHRLPEGPGAIHALSHPVGAVHDTHHGLTNAVFMPYVLAFNRPAVEAKLDRAAAYLGLTGGFEGFLAWVLELRQQLKIPRCGALRHRPPGSTPVGDGGGRPDGGRQPGQGRAAELRGLYEWALAGTV
jgi:hypothetical protein